ncbi:MAG: UDP-N-acetylglucosamine 1-carboxyvinyltransferase [candidate division WOR-3 bacterium]
MIRGGNPLVGETEAIGAKNAALSLMAACILVPEPVVLERVPDVQDVLTMVELLANLGIRIEKRDNDSWLIDAATISNHHASYELVSRMRASTYIMGPLLARLGRACVALPGGCSFGPRPINFHLDGLSRMGVSMETAHGEINATCRQLRGMEMEFSVRSVGATAHLMMAAALARGKTLILNAAEEPEVVAVADFLRSCGARIRGPEGGILEVEGTERLSSPGRFRNIPDRIEAGTTAVAGFITRGDIRINSVNPKDMLPLLTVMRAMGAEIEQGTDSIRVIGKNRPLSHDIVTNPHPGFPTDMQPPIMTALAVADGVSTVTETIYPDRFKHAFEMVRLGADITVDGTGRAIITGAERLSGAPVEGADLRGTAALVLAGLIAEGETEVSGIEHLERGYKDFEKKLSALGAKIEVV